MNKYDEIKRKLDNDYIESCNAIEVGDLLNDYLIMCRSYFKGCVGRYVSLTDHTFPFNDIVNKVDGLIIKLDDLFGYGEITVKIKTGRKKFLVFDEHVVFQKYYHHKFWSRMDGIDTELKNTVVESLNKRIEELG